MANDFYNNPSKKTLISFSILYIVSIVLIVLAITDVFRVSVIQGDSLVLYFLMGMSTLSLINLFRNYLKKKTKEENS